MLTTSNLKFSHDGKRQLSFPDIHCQKGEHWLIIGASGSGKTTLLHLLGGLLSPSSGTIHIHETEITRLNPSLLDTFRGQNIGIIFQTAHFVKALNVEENLILAQQLAGNKPNKKNIETLLSRLNIVHKSKSSPDALSVGEQQRLNIARALINTPSVILADEPTSALDDMNAQEVIQLLESQAREANATLLIVTHDNRLKEYFPNQVALSI